MRSLKTVVLVLLSTALTVLVSQTLDDSVNLVCGGAACTTGEQNGVLLVAKTAKRVIPPSSSSSISVGQTGPAYGQAVAFRSDRAPGIQTAVTWEPHPKTVTLSYPNLAEVPIQVWVICPDPDCGPVTQTVKDALNTFRSNSNDLLTEERTGFRLAQAGGAEQWIADETLTTGLSMFRDFVNDQCSDLNTAVTALGKKKADAVNVYLVRTVDNAPSNGYRCPVENLAVDGWSTYWTTRLHEVGHAMSLYDVALQMNPEANLMYHMPANPASRRYVTEGQTFRMHFNVDSSLNKVFGLREPAVLRDCGRTNADAERATPPCPPLATRIWPEN